jgi:competence protein ComEA
MAHVFSLILRAANRPGAENEGVRANTVIAGVAAAALLACLTARSPAEWRHEPEPARAHEIPPEQRIDINHASAAELMRVPGMKRTWAERIVRFRPYRTKQDLLERGVVPGDVFDRIRDYVIAHREKK